MFNYMRSVGKGRQAGDPIMEARIRRQVILLSILLHALFLACWNSAIELSPAQLIPAAAVPPRGTPLVFDLQPPQMPREVIATPSDAPTTPKPRKADFLSDKNALARNQEPAPRLPLRDEPFSRGDLASHDLVPQQQVAESGKNLPVPQGDGRNRPAPQGDGRNRPAENAELPVEKDAEMAGPSEPGPGALAQKPFQLDLPRIPHRQLDMRAAQDGGLSFNTYDWEFAPYMLALKERISRNIFPPLAFSKLGMIDGDTLLRFRIYPDGRLADLQLLSYSGHRSLMETSRFAVTASAPFPSLPADFPESYLEVTAKFSYFVKK
jgi:outer membrane biosynthesis protein TonB